MPRTEVHSIPRAALSALPRLHAMDCGGSGPFLVVTGLPGADLCDAWVVRRCPRLALALVEASMRYAKDCADRAFLAAQLGGSIVSADIAPITVEVWEVV